MFRGLLSNSCVSIPFLKLMIVTSAIRCYMRVEKVSNGPRHVSKNFIPFTLQPSSAHMTRANDETLLYAGPWQCVLLLIPRSFLDGSAVNYW
jgi:hypothetical protein